jgi:hypothetical protein
MCFFTEEKQETYSRGTAFRRVLAHLTAAKPPPMTTIFDRIIAISCFKQILLEQSYSLQCGNSSGTVALFRRARTLTIHTPMQCRDRSRAHHRRLKALLLTQWQQRRILSELTGFGLP